ncbi:integrase catalytic domain-containing protein [Trichonephila inaurata madagascariensis]|uniref:Integrase catalytic domain-containing protein n=1 Tax=Trichonephila inaurata madagascariensis TaxID=2747483 RepID=A0A8X6Y286_9ARAC|nr:integrase catalytic domain-containing protein [Trichonephila inaurata madagascariensis]
MVGRYGLVKSLKKPKSNVTPDFDIINSEKRKTVISAANHEGASEEKYYNRFSSYDRLLGVTAWMYRFFTKCKIEKSNRIIGVLTLEEMNRAEIAVLKIVQKEFFSGTDDKRLKAIQCYVDPNVTQKVDLGKPPVDRIFPTNEPTVQQTGRECSSETIPDEPDVQRTVNDFSSETVPEKRSRYGQLIKQIVRI